jgi:hypothetical protein
MKIGLVIGIILPIILSFFSFLFVLNYTGIKDLGSGFAYFGEQGFIAGGYHGSWFENVLVPQVVTSYDYNENFIIAKQLPREQDDSELGLGTIFYPLGRNEQHYWIIIKDGSIVFGPMDLIRFNELREELNIPIKLRLE